MKYICLGYYDEKKWEAMSESERNALIDECFAYDDVLRRNGHFIGGEGLQTAQNATTLRWKNGKVSITDGPYTETKEQLGGILVLEATDLNHAIQLMSKHPGVKGGPFEIRPAEDLTEMIRESERRRATTNIERGFPLKETGTLKSGTKQNLVFTRVFDAPVEQAWKAWTDPEHVRRWWGPYGFTCPVAKIDFREGGTSLVCMRAPKEFGGQDMYNIWTYTKILPMQEIEYLLHFADKDGNRGDPVTMGLPPDMPQEVRNVVTFKAVGENKTEMTVTEYDWAVGQMMEMSKMGMEQCLDKMAASFAET
jgi:uncharacterized protein YndB with AHSA1/START domain